jgi:low affinity Fe/Cu permease
MDEESTMTLLAQSHAREAVPTNHESAVVRWFTHFANAVARAAGWPSTFALCCVLILVWAVSGPVFHYSDTWQLVINTGTTIVTFLMVFLIQNTQNRGTAAIQAKLSELIRATADARNAYMGIEDLPEDEVEEMREHCADGEPSANSSTDGKPETPA